MGRKPSIEKSTASMTAADLRKLQAEIRAKHEAEEKARQERARAEERAITERIRAIEDSEDLRLGRAIRKAACGADGTQLLAVLRNALAPADLPCYDGASASPRVKRGAAKGAASASAGTTSAAGAT